ncbi:signal peptidase II [Caldanaerobius fijiensis DSM 17918]|uniref:Lipoprotein signal peptidase n=1 Tax=Caldanaerobius fijiensis DSM 17918 TaxID=1121256 RepID=A0A1M4SJL9_9THEO|nr:signal peptidase II [Caldanaerobius fijiensis]SHE32396.1 signal peptidase II [Caldanaerobius fijiensis DSM 17918]
MLELFIVILIIVIDQVSKYFARIYLRPVKTIPVIDNFFHLTYVENRGAAFGILQNQLWFFIVITIMVGFALIYMMISMPEKNKHIKLILAMILGGAIGNFIDRIRLGYVVDFLDFKIWSYIFNVADSFIVIGAILLGGIMLLRKENQ